MEEQIELIKNALIQVIKSLDPDTDIFFEEIKATDEAHSFNLPETYYFVEITSGTNITAGKTLTDTGLLIDIIYHEKHESNIAYLIKAAQLDAVLRPVFSFGDRHITIPEIGQRVVDHTLHVTFSLTFTWESERDESGDMMENIHIRF